MINGEYAILDFKSAKEVYFNNLIQVALYDIEITENGGFDKNGKKVFTLDKPITKHIQPNHICRVIQCTGFYQDIFTIGGNIKYFHLQAMIRSITIFNSY